MNLRVITDIANYFENEQHFEIPPRTPFVGRAFNATRAGIHADGLLKNEEIYNIFNTTDILGRPPLWWWTPFRRRGYCCLDQYLLFPGRQRSH